MALYAPFWRRGWSEGDDIMDLTIDPPVTPTGGHFSQAVRHQWAPVEVSFMQGESLVWTMTVGELLWQYEYTHTRDAVAEAIRHRRHGPAPEPENP